MKPTKLAWLIALAMGTCTGPVLADEPTPTPVPVESPAPPDHSPGPGPTDKLTDGPAKPESATEAKAEAHEKGEPEEKEPNVDNSQYINWGSIHYGGKDYYGGEYGDGNMDFKDVAGRDVHETQDEEKMSPPFIFMLINFGLLLVVLGKYGAPAARKLAEERHDLIKSAIDEATKLRLQAEAKLAEYETKLSKADAEIKAMVDGLRADAEADKVRMIAAAEATAAQMKRDAEQRIAAEIEHARATLTREVTAPAAAATEKLLRDKTTADDQNKLVAAFITDVANGPAQKGART